MLNVVGGALFNVFLVMLCLFVNGIFCYLKLDSICVVCNIFSLNISSFHILSDTNCRNVRLHGCPMLMLVPIKYHTVVKFTSSNK